MGQKSVFKVTATEIKGPKGNVLLAKTDTAKDIALIMWGDSAVVFLDGTEDTKIVTGSGWEIVIQEEFADFVTALSGTSITGS